jgi:hypothetical protein
MGSRILREEYVRFREREWETCLKRQGARFLLHTDESNPDVGRMYSGKIPVTPLVLDERDTGWITLYDILEENEDTLFVINSAARSNGGIEANGKNFSDALEDKAVPCDLVTFWPINR